MAQRLRKKMPKIRSESIAFQNGKNQRRHMYNCVAPRKKGWANSKAKRYTQRGSISRSNVINQEGPKDIKKNAVLCLNMFKPVLGLDIFQNPKRIQCAGHRGFVKPKAWARLDWSIEAEDSQRLKNLRWGSSTPDHESSNWNSRSCLEPCQHWTLTTSMQTRIRIIWIHLEVWKNLHLNENIKFQTFVKCRLSTRKCIE